MRGLEREIASVFRKVARDVVKNGPIDEAHRPPAVRVDRKAVIKHLGVPKVPKDKAELSDQVGMVNGLAWTSYGGEVLHTEAATMPGKGKLIVTGMLRDLMKESAQAAVTWVRARAQTVWASTIPSSRRTTSTFTSRGLTRRTALRRA